MRILMLGNSFTFYNEMPKILAEMLGAEVVAHTRGGASLREHLNPETELGKKTLPALKDEKWDYVVLQEQSNAPVTRKKAFLASARELCALIRENGATPVMYATWPYRDGSEKLAGVNMSYGEMADGLYAAYHEAAEESGALTADVGKAFTQIHGIVDLYAPDDFHPSPAGSVLAAATIARTIEAAERA